VSEGVAQEDATGRRQLPGRAEFGGLYFCKVRNHAPDDSSGGAPEKPVLTGGNGENGGAPEGDGFYTKAAKGAKDSGAEGFVSFAAFV
jgi:hypothetical protein